MTVLGKQGPAVKSQIPGQGMRDLDRVVLNRGFVENNLRRNLIRPRPIMRAKMKLRMVCRRLFAIYLIVTNTFKLVFNILELVFG